MNSFPKQDNIQTSNIFKKGITLEQYIKLSQNFVSQPYQPQQESEEQLFSYIQSKTKPNYKISTFAINELDQDNYEQQNLFSQQTTSGLPYLQGNQQQKQSIQNKNKINYRGISTDNKNINILSKNKKKYRIRNNSNTPKKPNIIDRDEMFRSLYGNSFAFNMIHQSQPSVFRFTIHNKFYKMGSNKQVNQKQVDFKLKHKKHYNQIMKYENIIRNKYNHNIETSNIRIDGIKDRLNQRKNYHKKV